MSGAGCLWSGDGCGPAGPPFDVIGGGGLAPVCGLLARWGAAMTCSCWGGGLQGRSLCAGVPRKGPGVGGGGRRAVACCFLPPCCAQQGARCYHCCCAVLLLCCCVHACVGNHAKPADATPRHAASHGRLTGGAGAGGGRARRTARGRAGRTHLLLPAALRGVAVRRTAWRQLGPPAAAAGGAGQQLQVRRASSVQGECGVPYVGHMSPCGCNVPVWTLVECQEAGF